MNAELKRKWIVRLKSSKEKKCKGGLHIGDKFCALGLLLDEIDNTLWIPKHDRRMGWNHRNGICYNWLPADIESKVGSRQVEYIMTMNDKNDNSFEEIAQYIEENVPSD